MDRYPPPDLSPAEFELFVKRELDAMAIELLEYRSTHLMKLEAADGTYAIDVVARFKALGVEYLTLIECKHHRRRVEREDVQVLWAKI